MHCKVKSVEASGGPGPPMTKWWRRMLSPPTPLVSQYLAGLKVWHSSNNLRNFNQKYLASIIAMTDLWRYLIRAEIKDIFIPIICLFKDSIWYIWRTKSLLSLSLCVAQLYLPPDAGHRWTLPDPAGRWNVNEENFDEKTIFSSQMVRLDKRRRNWSETPQTSHHQTIQTKLRDCLYI